jgi:hypothetical protein
MIKKFLEKLIIWLTKLKIKLKAKIKTEVSKVDTEVKVIEKQIITDTQEGEQFMCHYCHKAFTLLSKNIFPVSVPMLYKESYVQGKGVLCPHCGQTCITG